MTQFEGKDRRSPESRKQDRFYVAVGSALAIAGLLAFTISSTLGNNDTSTRDGQLCILAELEQHRINSYQNDRDTATAMGRPFNAPAGSPGELVRELSGACDRFLGQ